MEVYQKFRIKTISALSIVWATC